MNEEEKAAEIERIHNIQIALISTMVDRILAGLPLQDMLQILMSVAYMKTQENQLDWQDFIEFMKENDPQKEGIEFDGIDMSKFS